MVEYEQCTHEAKPSQLCAALAVASVDLLRPLAMSIALARQVACTVAPAVAHLVAVLEALPAAAWGFQGGAWKPPLVPALLLVPPMLLVPPLLLSPPLLLVPPMLPL